MFCSSCCCQEVSREESPSVYSEPEQGKSADDFALILQFQELDDAMDRTRHQNRRSLRTRAARGTLKPVAEVGLSRTSSDPGSDCSFMNGKTLREDNRVPRTGLDPQRSRSSDDLDDIRNRPNIDLMLATYVAINHGELEKLKRLFKVKRVVHPLDRDGNTALHVCARRGNIQSLKWLLRNSHIPVTVKNSREETCAHQAVKRGDIKFLKAIIYCGTIKPLTIACERDKYGLTVLHLAAIRGNHNLVSWLVNTFGKTLVLIKNNHGETALHFAAAQGYEQCVQALCKLGKQSSNQKDRTGATPTFYAAKEGHVLCMQHLLSLGHADASLTTADGISPLQAAAQSGKLEVTKVLLQDLNASALSHKSQDGATVFHMAAANGHAEVLKLLLDQKAAKEAVLVLTSTDGSVAHDAADNGHVVCLKLLVEAGLDMHARDQRGDTPYSLALRSTSSECALYARSFTGGEVCSDDVSYGGVPRLQDNSFIQISSPVHHRKLTEEEVKNFKNNSKVTKTVRMRNKKLVERLRIQNDLKNIQPIIEDDFDLLRGEIFLRAKPAEGVTDREKRKLQVDGTILANQKLRPAIVSLPRIDYDELMKLRQSGNSLEVDIRRTYDAIPAYSAYNDVNSNVSSPGNSTNEPEKDYPSESEQGDSPKVEPKKSVNKLLRTDFDAPIGQYPNPDYFSPENFDDIGYIHRGRSFRKPHKQYSGSYKTCIPCDIPRMSRGIDSAPISTLYRIPPPPTEPAPQPPPVPPPRRRRVGMYEPPFYHRHQSMPDFSEHMNNKDDSVGPLSGDVIRPKYGRSRSSDARSRTMSPLSGDVIRPKYGRSRSSDARSRTMSPSELRRRRLSVPIFRERQHNIQSLDNSSQGYLSDDNQTKDTRSVNKSKKKKRVQFLQDYSDNSSLASVKSNIEIGDYQVSNNQVPAAPLLSLTTPLTANERVDSEVSQTVPKTNNGDVVPPGNRRKNPPPRPPTPRLERNAKISPKINEMVNILENSGIMDSYYRISRSNSTADLPETANNGDFEWERNSSTMPRGRSCSPSSPSGRYAYIRDGVVNEAAIQTVSSQPGRSLTRRESMEHFMANIHTPPPEPPPRHKSRPPISPDVNPSDVTADTLYNEKKTRATGKERRPSKPELGLRPPPRRKKARSRIRNFRPN